jgi:hypothetical protein
MGKRKDPAAVTLGRKGGLVRVKKGYAVLSKRERIERAKEGAAARWQKEQ